MPRLFGLELLDLFCFLSVLACIGAIASRLFLVRGMYRVASRHERPVPVPALERVYALADDARESVALPAQLGSVLVYGVVIGYILPPVQNVGVVRDGIEQCPAAFFVLKFLVERESASRYVVHKILPHTGREPLLKKIGERKFIVDRK